MIVRRRSNPIQLFLVMQGSILLRIVPQIGGEDGGRIGLHKYCVRAEQMQRAAFFDGKAAPSVSRLDTTIVKTV
jgi:hypothetical protein